MNDSGAPTSPQLAPPTDSSESLVLLSLDQFLACFRLRCTLGGPLGGSLGGFTFESTSNSPRVIISCAMD